MTVHAPTLERTTVSGATLLLLPDTSLPLVRFAIGLRQGALIDPAGRAGRGHVMLELLSRGTEVHDRRTWNALLERQGTQVGATMASDLGLVHGVALARYFEPSVALLTEALLRPAFSESERVDLIGELGEQLVAERDDDEALLEVFWRRALYPGHPLWRRPSGEPDDLARLTAEDMTSAHRVHLNRADLIIACSGDLTLEEVERLFAPLLAGLAAGPLAAPSLPAFVQPSGLEVWVVDKPARTQAQLAVGRLALAGGHPDVYPFWLGTTAFGGTFTSELTQEVRDVRGWSYSAYAEFARRRPYLAPLALKTAPALGDAVACLALELELYARLARGELRPGAIEFARSYLLNRYPLEVASPADLLLPAVRNELLGLGADELFRVPERLAALTPEEVTLALRRHLAPDAVLAVMVATADKVVDDLRARLPAAVVRVVDFADDTQMSTRA